jgi:hypothetical protein
MYFGQTVSRKVHVVSITDRNADHMKFSTSKWPLHKDDMLFQSGTRPTGLDIYFAFHSYSFQLASIVFAKHPDFCSHFRLISQIYWKNT